MERLSERRAREVDHQKRRNKRDLFKTVAYIVMLIAWSLCLLGMADFIAGGW